MANDFDIDPEPSSQGRAARVWPAQGWTGRASRSCLARPPRARRPPRPRRGAVSTRIEACRSSNRRRAASAHNERRLITTVGPLITTVGPLITTVGPSLCIFF
jgi:hypothetical protein